MLKVKAFTSSSYICTLTDEEERKVINYIRDNSEKFKSMDAEHAILMAVIVLSKDGKLDLYKRKSMIDFCTEKIEWTREEKRTPEEILNSYKYEYMCDKANENIEKLVERLIDSKRSIIGDRCPHSICAEKRDTSCDECRETYFENMRERLLKEYLIE